MFSKDFAWGVASSAYQIEGKHEELGGGNSIWDTFVKKEGVILNNDTGDVACDHLARYADDFKLMKELGIHHYRFSVNWSRILPNGTGEVNQKAIDAYRDMILEMKKNDIVPYLTLFHWEYPQALHDKGGWLHPDSPKWFGDYAKIIAENFSDICEYYFTINEPQCIVGCGYLQGEHAPGERLNVKDTFRIAHNLLKAHGLAVKALRQYSVREVKVGFAPTAGVAYPFIDFGGDIEAARNTYFGCDWPLERWNWNVTWFTDPVVFGHYPEDAMEKFKDYVPQIEEGDMELISQPIDFLGQNIYNGYWITEGADRMPKYVDRPEDYPKTDLGWPITPKCMYWGPKFLYERYKLPIYITENGAAFGDEPDSNDSTKVHDPKRVSFLKDYLSWLKKACDEGIDVRGYFLWSIMDNFEWAQGYGQRFGIVYVDFESQKRIPKDSAYWYKEVCDTNGECIEPVS